MGGNRDVMHVRTRMQYVSRNKFYGLVPESFPDAQGEQMNLTSSEQDQKPVSTRLERARAPREGQEVFRVELQSACAEAGPGKHIS